MPPPPLLLLLLSILLLLLAASPAAAKRKPANEKSEPDPARVNIADGFGSETYPPLGKISRTGGSARSYRCAVAPPAGGRGCRRLMLQLARRFGAAMGDVEETTPVDGGQ
jgi:hypothetical protein